MASGKRTTPGPGEGARRKRPAPTIDLTATEVDPATGGDKKPPPRPEQTSRAKAHADPVDRAWERVKGHFTWTNFAAAMTGAVIVLLVMLTLALTGRLPVMSAGAGANDGRIGVLEKQLRELANRPAVSDGKAIDVLSQRIAKAEDAAREAVKQRPAADPAIAERLAAAENAMRSLGVALTALTRRADETAGNVTEARNRADAAAKTAGDLQAAVNKLMQDAAQKPAATIDSKDVDALAKRIGALESAIKTAREHIAKSTDADIPARFALSAAALRDAVTRGAPFANDLTAVKSLGAEPAALAPLEPFAATGVPGEAALARELAALIPAMLAASGVTAPPSGGGFLERLQANAGNLVRIRPVDAPPGSDPSAALARIEIKAAQSDIAGVLPDIAALPAKARALAGEWIKKATARTAALEASRKLAADAARALGRP